MARLGSTPLLGDGAKGGELVAQQQQCSLPRCIVSLVKTILGAGILALPGGVAIFSDDPGVGLAWAIGLLALSTLLSAYTFWLLGRLCGATGRDTLASSFGAIFGERWAWVAASTVILQTSMLCMMYSILIPDLCLALGGAAGLGRFPWFRRDVILCVVTVVVLLPLSLLRSLKALAPFSSLGVLGVAFTAMFVTYRQHDGSYAVNGTLLRSAPFQPSFNDKGTHLQACFVLVAMLSTSTVAQFSSARFWRELENCSVSRYGVLTIGGFVGGFVLMVAIMASGFLTFGGGCQAEVLDNYAAEDTFAVVARFGILLSVMCSFPIMVGCCRDDLVEVCGKEATQAQLDAVTVTLIAASTFVALIVDNLGIVVALGGAVAGNALTLIIPSSMFVGLHGLHRAESYVNVALVLLGFLLVAACVGVTLITAVNPDYFTT